MNQIWFPYLAFNQIQASYVQPIYLTEIVQIQHPQLTLLPIVDNQKTQNEIPNISQTDANSRPNSQRIIIPSIEELEKIQKKSSRKYWSATEDKKLIDIFEQFPKQWNKISENIQGRNQAMCYSRYRRITQGKKKYWTQEIDKKIIEKVNQYGFKWKKISKYIPDRSPKQIRERYLNFLRENISKLDWTTEQDIKICQLIQILGHKWKKFQDYIEGRTENQIKGRYYGHLKKVLQLKTKEDKSNL